MKNYIGTKEVKGKPMNRLAYNKLRGWILPSNENREEEGYLVEYLDGTSNNVKGYKGYISWSPKKQFEDAYHSSGNMTFGEALVALKSGKKIARSGWNGKDMFLYMQEGTMISGTARNKILQEKIDESDLNTVEILSHIDMYTINSHGKRAFLCSWLASQTDMLSEDWEIVD